MRIAIGLAASALVLMAAGAIGLVGTWGLGAGAVLLLLASGVAATVMESRDLTSRVGDHEAVRLNVLRRAA